VPPILRISFVVVLAALGFGAELPARATATIRGAVSVAAVPAPDRPLVSALGNSTPDPIDRRRAVVYLEAEPQQAFEEPRPGRARIDQRGEQFFPRVLAVTAGTVVEFPNSDKTFHNVFSLSRVKTFDLGRYRPGRTGTVTFDRPGIVPIFCDIHANMRAWVLVFRHAFFAVTDEAGRYSIASVPAGTYTVRVWSEIGRAAERRVTVTDGGTAEVDFRIGGTP
jgi:plastocyanin